MGDQMFEGFKTGSRKLGDVTISYVVAGNGPPILLLHGYPQTKALWAKVAPVLAQDYTVVCADLRGYGDSSKPANTPDNSAYSFRTMAADQLALMRALGFARFHLIGHDRGGRAAHRLALDHPEAVQSLTVMDIIPTLLAYQSTNQRFAQSYWHWFFLTQRAPFPERLIACDPDHFYQSSLLGWGAAKLTDFNAEMLAEYRRVWRTAQMHHGSCCDYRAAATIDLEHDRQDLQRRVECPTFVMYGVAGAMAKQFDVPQTWGDRCTDITACAIEGGHFFVDEQPDAVAEGLRGFLAAHL